VSLLHEHADAETLSALSRFRDRFYGCLDARADALFELADAAICAEGRVTSLVELSLASVFRRGHGALYDALAEGVVDEERLRDLLVEQMEPDAPLIFGIDATTFPRPNAECSPDRGLHYAPCRCDGRRKVVPGWEFQWVTGLEWGRSSWTLPVDARRIEQGACPVTVTADQIRDLAGRMGSRPAPLDPRPHPPVALIDLDRDAVPLRDALQPPAKSGCPAHVDPLHRAHRPPPPSRIRLRDGQDPPHVVQRPLAGELLLERVEHEAGRRPGQGRTAPADCAGRTASPAG
jgi:hypothetical protein